jgi:hypothetical protein
MITFSQPPGARLAKKPAWPASERTASSLKKHHGWVVVSKSGLWVVCANPTPPTILTSLGRPMVVLLTGQRCNGDALIVVLQNLRIGVALLSHAVGSPLAHS